jgi:hypothetical protein
MKHCWLLALLLCARALATTPVEDMTAAAQNLLAALNDEQRGKAVFELKDDERLNWHFIPKERKGLTLKEMSSAQRHLAYGLLSAGLSHRGYLKATTIMSLEQILQEMEGAGRKFPRDPELYHVSIFGKPSATGTWGWRVEGHHLSVNFTIVDGQVGAATPSFMGTNPAEVRQGSRAGLRVLGVEEDLARELVKSLSTEDRKNALIDVKAPDDIITAASRKAEIKDPKGLPLSKLSAKQREIAMKVIREYVGRVRPELASADLAKIEKADTGKILFAWAGGLEKGEKHYYRLHGPTFLLEYDNTQNDANHVHAVWRDLQNDFGLDLLGEHYEKSHTK